jgi:hypothetical protein
VRHQLFRRRFGHRGGARGALQRLRRLLAGGPSQPLELKVDPETGAMADEPLSPDEELFNKPTSELPGEVLPKAFRARAQADKRVREAAVQGAVWAAMGASLALILVLAVVFREDVVRLWPRAAGAYAAVRLPVNPVGLTIEDVHARPALQDGHPALIVTGSVRNIRPEPLISPPLKVVLRDKDGHPLLARMAPPPDGPVAPGQSRRFSLNLVDPPAGAATADIDFAQVKARPAAVVASRGPATLPPEPQAMALRITGAVDARPLASDSPYALPSTAQPTG